MRGLPLLAGWHILLWIPCGPMRHSGVVMLVIQPVRHAVPRAAQPRTESRTCLLPSLLSRGPGCQASFVLSLSLLGINLMPLATAGLGSGVVLGFASQSVLANVVAGCNLVRSLPPFLLRCLHMCMQSAHLQLAASLLIGDTGCVHAMHTPVCTGPASSLAQVDLRHGLQGWTDCNGSQCSHYASLSAQQCLVHDVSNCATPRPPHSRHPHLLFMLQRHHWCSAQATSGQSSTTGDELVRVAAACNTPAGGGRPRDPAGCRRRRGRS